MNQLNSEELPLSANHNTGGGALCLEVSAQGEGSARYGFSSVFICDSSSESGENSFVRLRGRG